MKKPLLAALSILLLLGACGSGERRWYNPLGWFGGSRDAEVTSLVTDVGTPSDPRPLVDQVLALSVDRYPGGAIVRATGLPQTQGYWAGELVEEPVTEDGTLNFRFVVLAPPDGAPVSTQQSREVIVAASVSDLKLQTVRQITVTGARSARTSQR